MRFALHGANGSLAYGVPEYVVEHYSAREGRVDVITEQTTVGERREALLQDVFVNSAKSSHPVPPGVVVADGVGIEHSQQLHGVGRRIPYLGQTLEQTVRTGAELLGATQCNLCTLFETVDDTIK